MKTKTTAKISHTQRIREKFVSNQLTILKETGMTEEERFYFKTDIGVQFLQELYPEEKKFDEFRNSHKKNPLFWQWFGYVWAKWEADYLRYKSSVFISEKDYKSDFQQLVCDLDARNDFYNIYINKMIHGR